MLAVYYDVKMGNSFDDIFVCHYKRGLHQALEANISTSKPLLLSYRDSPSFTNSASLPSTLLLEDYIKPEDITNSLSNVLELIARYGYTAFVGIDECTPAWLPSVARALLESNDKLYNFNIHNRNIN